METITRIESATDPRIALYQNIKDAQLQVRENLFLVEGKFVVQRLLKESRFPVHSVFILDKQFEQNQDLLLSAQLECPIFIAAQNVIDEIVGFHFHRGFLALGWRTSLPSASEIMKGANRLVLMEGLTIPNNVGSIFRNAAGLGVERIILDPHCADPLYRMATRVSIGTTLSIPWTRALDWKECLTQLKEESFTLFAMTPRHDSIDLTELRSVPRKWALILGAEGEGLSDRTLEIADEKIKIPMSNDIDSLNVASAAAIGIFRLATKG